MAPGPFHTAPLRQISEEAIRRSFDRIPMKRAGELEEIGALVGRLALEGRFFSTGTMFDISGGQAASQHSRE